MKTTLQLLTAFLGLTFHTQAQSVYELSLQNRQAFVKDAQPLVNKMAEKRIVALGEGTHGTAEFYTVRYWITRELVEKKRIYPDCL